MLQFKFPKRHIETLAKAGGEILTGIKTTIPKTNAVHAGQGIVGNRHSRTMAVAKRSPLDFASSDRQNPGLPGVDAATWRLILRHRTGGVFLHLWLLPEQSGSNALTGPADFVTRPITNARFQVKEAK